MTRSSEEIEREVEATRNDLDRTVEALKDRMSAGQIVDELMGSLKGTGASDMAANLGRQAKDNPIPVALISAGIAWLMFGKAPERRYREPRSFVADPYGGDTLFDGDPAYDIDTARYHEDFDPTTGAELSSEGGLKEKASEAARRVKNAASGVAAKVSNVAHGGADRVSDTFSDAREGISHARSRAGQGLSQARGRAGEGVQAGRERLSSAAGTVKTQAAEYRRKAQRSYYETLESEPLILAALGVAVGAAIGAAIPASRLENRYVGKFRDRALDQGKQMAQERAHQAKDIAQSALGAAREEADRQGIPTGVEGLADKVSEVAKAGLDTAKREMEERRTH